MDNFLCELFFAGVFRDGTPCDDMRHDIVDPMRAEPADIALEHPVLPDQACAEGRHRAPPPPAPPVDDTVTASLKPCFKLSISIHARR